MIKTNIWGKKPLSVLLAAVMLLTLLPAASLAAGGNSYGHQVTYAPLTSLKYNGNTVKFFDYSLSQFPTVTGGKSTMSDQFARLVSSGYSFNKLGTRQFANNTANAPNPFSGAISGLKDYQATYRFNVPVADGYEYFFGGNIHGWHKKTGFITYYNQWEEASFSFMGFSHTTESDDYFHGGKDSGYAVGTDGNWQSSGRMSDFRWKSRDNDIKNNNEAALNMGMILGRDIDGPKVTGITMTDSSNRAIPNNTITLDWLSAHSDRTVYFKVALSEAVKFESGVNPENITLNIRTIGRDGTEGSLAKAAFLRYSPTETGNSAVSATEMVFEYQVPDPYKDNTSVTQERGFIYSFSKVNINASDNPVLFNKTRDLSGNLASTNKGGQPVAYSVAMNGKVDILPLSIASGEKITGIDVYRELSADTNKEFINQGELIKIQLTLNKPLALSYTDYTKLPSITLNIKDQSGQYVTIVPTAYDNYLKPWYKHYTTGEWTQSSSQTYAGSWRITDPAKPYYTMQVPNALLSKDGKTVTYYYQAVPGRTFLEDARIAVTKVTPQAGTKDASGYQLLTYAQSGGMLVPVNAPSVVSTSTQEDAKNLMKGVTVAHPYKLDFVPPQVDVTAALTDHTVVFTADIDDANLDGCDASFHISFNGAIDGALSYKPSSNPAYEDNNWSQTNAAVSARTPIISGKAYMIVKLPDGAEFDAANVAVTVTDEAGNAAVEKKTLSMAYDTLSPRITLMQGYDTGAAKPYKNYAKVDARDTFPTTVTYAWTNQGDVEPDSASYTEAGGDTIRYTADDLNGNEIYEKTLWIKAVDGEGNIVTAQMDFTFNNTSAALDISAANNTDMLTGGVCPTATIRIQNAKAYWYALAETTGPWTATWGSGFGSTAADYIKAGLAGNAASVYSRTGEDVIATAVGLTDSNPDADGYQNDTGEITITAEASTKALKHLKMGSLSDGGTGYQGTGDGISLNAADMLELPQTTRPLELLVAYQDSDNEWHVESILFNTFYSTPEIASDPIRFSTNNRFGVREDTYRINLESRYTQGSGNNYFESDNQYFNRPGLAWADEVRSYNMPNLYGFAEAEFTLQYDNATGLDRVSGIAVSMVKVKTPLYGSPASGETIHTWNVDKNSLTPMGDMLYYGTNEGEYGQAAYIANVSKNLYTYTLTFDPGTIDRAAYEIDDDGTEYLISYEFRATYTYADNTTQTNTTAKFVFDNGGWEIAGYENNRHHDSFDHFGALAVFDGEELVSEVPVVPYSADSNIDAHIKAPNIYAKLREASARQRIMTDYLDINGRGLLGTGLVMRAGTSVSGGEIQSPVLLNNGEESTDGRFAFVADGVLQCGTLDSSGEVIVYYQLVDMGRGIEGPIHAVKLKKDDTPPVVELSVSAGNQMPASEVYAKITSLTDETGAELVDGMFYAVQYGTPENGEEPYMSDYNEGFFLTPDEDGGYTFTGNGFIVAAAIDGGGNANETLMVNGTETVRKEDDLNRLDTYAVYHITNIDRNPPSFLTEPAFTANADGSFDISAQASSDTVRAYIQFDQAYTALLTGDDTEIPRFEIGNIPGRFSGELNVATGEINAKIYVMSDETVKLTQATLMIEDAAGNSASADWIPSGGLAGVVPKITNTVDPEKNVPLYKYGEDMTFSVPVRLPEWNTGLYAAHSGLPIYADGALIVAYTDVFNRYFTETVYADISGGSHTFTASPIVPTNSDVTIEITPSKGFTVGEYTKTMTTNGDVTYTVTPTDGGPGQSYTMPITNIDKTSPEANVSVTLDSTEDADGMVYLYSAVYSLTGFSEDNVTVSGASSVRFDAISAALTHTFTFTDEAGNVGTLEVDASELSFVNPTDTKISGYRLSYFGGGRQIGEFVSGQTGPLSLTPANTDISVKVEAFNAGGHVVPSSLSEQLVFTCESGIVSIEQSKTATLTGVGSGNTFDVTAFLPDGAIDKQPPTGGVDYRPQSNGNIRVYLVHNNNDLTEDGVRVIGQDSRGIPFVLLSDSSGYYVEFASNGTGYFLLRDKAGNASTIALAVASIDNDPPELGSEGWSSLINASSKDVDFAARLQKIITTPTNNSIKLFLSFNEQLSQADFDVYAIKANEEGSTALPLPNKEEYVAVTVAGNTVTVEFLQNCQLRLTVYDMRGNGYTLWRPEDGPISGIDKGAPVITNTPLISYTDNKARVTYEFSEEVTLTQNAASSYQTSHTLIFDGNGTYILTFADKAGNVVSAYPVVDQIDDLAPRIIPTLEYFGSGTEYGTPGTDGFYTSKDAKFKVELEDATTDGSALSVKRLSGAAVTVTGGEFAIGENGVYTITATDKWGNANSANVSVDAIDKTAPGIRFDSTGAVEVMPGTGADEVKSALLEGVTATDLQSGVAPGFPAVSLEDVSLTIPGAYTATITVTDNCGNTRTASQGVIVTDTAGKYLAINGSKVSVGDMFITPETEFTIDTAALGSETFTLYYAEGKKTSAQMKYATAFTGSFTAGAKGYFTVVAQSENRGRYVFYVYIY